MPSRRPPAVDPAGPALPPVGGMALVEGVMMRGPDRWAAAIRRADARIEIVRGTVPGWARRAARVPLARGIAALAEAMSVGVRVLVWSSARHDADRRPDQAAPVTDIGSVRVARALLPALAIAIGLFFVLPALLANLLAGSAGAATFNAVETGVRLAVVLGYLVAVGRLPDVRRVFAYHGAEHKVVALHEATSGGELTVEGARVCSTRHARCGTTFLLVVIGLSTALHLLVGKPSLPWLLASRALLVPVVAALAYELITWVGRRPAGRRRWILAPGLALQGLTTDEPDDGQLEVAVVALRNALSEEPVTADPPLVLLAAAPRRVAPAPQPAVP